jgi:hypothetical protein
MQPYSSLDLTNEKYKWWNVEIVAAAENKMIRKS